MQGVGCTPSRCYPGRRSPSPVPKGSPPVCASNEVSDARSEASQPELSRANRVCPHRRWIRMTKLQAYYETRPTIGFCTKFPRNQLLSGCDGGKGGGIAPLSASRRRSRRLRTRGTPPGPGAALSAGFRELSSWLMLLCKMVLLIEQCPIEMQRWTSRSSRSMANLLRSWLMRTDGNADGVLLPIDCHRVRGRSLTRPLRMHEHLTCLHDQESGA